MVVVFDEDQMMPLTPGKNKPNHDLVSTPRPLALEIIQHFPLNGKVLDPSAGSGAFFDQLPDHCDKFACEIERGVDFLKFEEEMDWVITNPPWSKMRDFLKHGMKISDNVVFLSTMTHFCTRARLRDLRDNGWGLREFYCVPNPKAPWPGSGFQLGAAWIQRDWLGPLTLTGKIGA